MNHGSFYHTNSFTTKFVWSVPPQQGVAGMWISLCTIWHNWQVFDQFTNVSRVSNAQQVVIQHACSNVHNNVSLMHSTRRILMYRYTYIRKHIQRLFKFSTVMAWQEYLLDGVSRNANWLTRRRWITHVSLAYFYLNTLTWVYAMSDTDNWVPLCLVRMSHLYRALAGLFLAKFWALSI